MLAGRRIVLVEDDEFMGASLSQRLALEGAQVQWLKQMVRALGAIRTPSQPIDAVICDIGLPDGSGEELFTTLCRTATPPPFLFDMSVFLERLTLLVSQRADLDFPMLMGVSPAARRIEALITATAADPRPVLIRGGPGTGKDLIARRLHDLSDRRAAPFVSVNLAREQDADQALFGPGRGLKAVGEGTLFVNAITRMPASAQSALLGAIDRGIEGRLITACDDDIDARIAEDTFSRELFYRLAPTEIPVPPLSSRPEDAVWLLQHLFRKLAPSHAPELRGIGALCEDAARGHAWPGGGREVRARLLRGLAMAVGPLLQPSDLFPERLVRPDGLMSLAEARDAAEKAQIIAALDRTGGQVGEAARLLRIARTTLWEKMQKFDLS